MGATVTARIARGAEAAAYFEPSTPDIRAERILRIQGYKDLGCVRPAITRAANEMAASAMRLTTARIAYRFVAIRGLRGGVLTLAEGGPLRCAAFDRQFEACTEVAPFVLSLGHALSDHVIELAGRGDLLEAVLLETAGWLGIEDATRQFKAHVREAAERRGSRITPRLGPGYTYRIGKADVMWPLEEQDALFGLLEGAELPATLLASCAMSPKMSRSGLFGLAPISTAPAAVRREAPANQELKP